MSAAIVVLPIFLFLMLCAWVGWLRAGYYEDS